MRGLVCLDFTVVEVCHSASMHVHPPALIGNTASYGQPDQVGHQVRTSGAAHGEDPTLAQAIKQNSPSHLCLYGDRTTDAERRIAPSHVAC